MVKKDTKKELKEEMTTMRMNDSAINTIKLIEEEMKDVMNTAQAKYDGLRQHAANFIQMVAEKEMNLKQGTWKYDAMKYVFLVKIK